MSVLAALAPLAAGLGLFFCGVRFVALGIEAVSGRALGRLLARAVRSTPLAALAGIVGGAATQGSQATIVLVSGLMQAGAVREDRAVLVPVWSHVGASALVAMVSVDLSMGVSWLLAAVGFAQYLNVDSGSERRRYWLQVLLGTGLLFLGVDLVGRGVGALQGLLAARGVLGMVGSNPVLLGCLGFGLSLVTQSSTVAAAIGAALAQAGLAPALAMLPLLLGGNLAAAGSYAALAQTGPFARRRMMLAQAAQKAAGSLVLALAILVWSMGSGGVPDAVPGAGLLATVFLATQVAGSAACSVAAGPLLAWLRRCAPDGGAVQPGVPLFLNADALHNPIQALDASRREQVRIAASLPTTLDGLRSGGGSGVDGAALRLAGEQLGTAVRAYIAAVLDRGPPHEAVSRALRHDERALCLLGLHETLHEFAAAVAEARAAGAGADAAGALVEALHAGLALLAEGFAAADAEDLALAAQMLEVSGDAIERARLRLVRPDLPPRVQAQLLRAAGWFERAAWLGRRAAGTGAD